MLKISEKERERVRIVNEPLASANDDPSLAHLPQVVLSHRMGQPLASVLNRVVYTLAGGSIFALDASTGDVLWRRFVGFETTHGPLPLSPLPGADALAVDQRRQEIMRLEARTGKLLWRLAISEPFARRSSWTNAFVSGAVG